MIMAAKQVNKKRKSSRSNNNCPKAVLDVVPSDCSKIKFSDLKPGEDYEFKAIIGKISHLCPIGKRCSGFRRKLLVTDALSEAEENSRRLTVFLLDQFASDSKAAEVDGFIIVTNFTVENGSHLAANDIPVQVLVKKEESQVWFARKVNSKSPKTRKKQKTTDEEESLVILNHHYEYTKLGDLIETNPKDSCNVYGIVESCDIRISQEKKMQILDLTLIDQTEAGFSCVVFAEGGEAFPDVYPGDILRIHRMQVQKFRGRLRGRCHNPKFILVFGKDNEGDKPRTVAKTFTFTPDDITRFRELNEWYNNKTAPKLICEIKRDDFVNFVCQVIGVYISKTTDVVILKVWDGTKTNVFPGTHWGMREEILDQKLFTLARDYYIVLSVYGHHAQKAAELKPGQYIEVKDAHLYSPKNNPDDCKLCLHAGNKDGRGIFALNETDSKVLQLNERLEKAISDKLEFGNQTSDLLSQNNSIFLNCDISVFTPNTQPEAEENEVTEVPAQDEESAPENRADIAALNEPLTTNEVLSQKTVVSVVNASIKPGQISQEFGLGMPRDEAFLDDENRISVISEPDPVCNMTPLQTRYFFHDPLQLCSQAVTSSIFPATRASGGDEWWNFVPTLSVTDGHSSIKPTSLVDVVEHNVPWKFRIFAVVLGFKPETTSIEKFIHLYCPRCFYISEDSSPSLNPCETRDGLSYYFCPECSTNEVARDHWPVLQYTFLILFSLHDGTGPPFIEAYIWKENALDLWRLMTSDDGAVSVKNCRETALITLNPHVLLWDNIQGLKVKLFKGATPEEALRDSATADSILHMLWNICPNCKPFNSSTYGSTLVYPVLDCCILSYHAADSIQYQMFDTILL